MLLTNSVALPIAVRPWRWRLSAAPRRFRRWLSASPRSFRPTRSKVTVAIATATASGTAPLTATAVSPIVAISPIVAGPPAWRRWRVASGRVVAVVPSSSTPALPAVTAAAAATAAAPTAAGWLRRADPNVYARRRRWQWRVAVRPGNVCSKAAASNAQAIEHVDGIMRRRHVNVIAKC